MAPKDRASNLSCYGKGRAVKGQEMTTEPLPTKASDDARLRRPKEPELFERKHQNLIAVGHGFVMVRWFELTLAGCARIEDIVRQAPAAPRWVNLFGDGALLPTVLDKRVSTSMARLDAACQSVHMVLDGASLSFAAMRGTAAALLCPSASGRHLHPTLEACLASCADAPTAALLELALGAHLLRPERRSA